MLRLNSVVIPDCDSKLSHLADQKRIRGVRFIQFLIDILRNSAVKFKLSLLSDQRRGSK